MELYYEKPRSVLDACRLLAEASPRAVVLAGGTDLLLRLREPAREPTTLVDIKGIMDLSACRWEAEGDLVLGSAVTMQRVCEDPQIIACLPALAEGARAVGSLQIRNRATVAGNLCNASPCMDTAPPLLVMGARVRVQSVRGEREVPLPALFAGPKKTTLAGDELCTAVLVPARARHLRTAFAKIKRGRGHDLALVNVAVAMDPAEGTMVAAIGSCAATSVLTRTLVGIDAGTADPAAVGEELAAAAGEVIQPIDDVRSTAEYRRDMTATLCRRLAAHVLATAQRSTR